MCVCVSVVLYVRLFVCKYVKNHLFLFVVQGFICLCLHAFPDAVYNLWQLIQWLLPPQQSCQKKGSQVMHTHTLVFSLAFFYKHTTSTC